MKWLLLVVSMLPAAVNAEGLNWGTVTGSRFRADYVNPAPMRLRVFSPKGGTIEVRLNNKVVAKGTIPFEYRPPQEGFISVSVSLPNGKRWWGNSVRMRAKTECQLWVLGPPGTDGPTVDAPGAASPPEAPAARAVPPPGDSGAIEPPAHTTSQRPPPADAVPPPMDPSRKAEPAPARAPSEDVQPPMEIPAPVEPHR